MSDQGGTDAQDRLLSYSERCAARQLDRLRTSDARAEDVRRNTAPQDELVQPVLRRVELPHAVGLWQLATARSGDEALDRMALSVAVARLA